MAVAVLGLAACEEDDAVYGPLVDTAPPVVSITNAQTAGDTLTTTVDAEDFIALAFVVTELRRTDQFETVITAAGDTIVLGRLIAVDTTRFAGRTVQASVSVTFFTGLTNPTDVQIRAIAVDSQDNEASATAVVTVGGGPGGPLGAPTISIYSPLPNSTVRDNTLIRVGIRASDESGLQQLNVVLTNPAANPPAIPAADTIRFAVFRTDVDTLLDFFIPQGALGTLTITAEAINLNTLSALAQISVTVATEVPDDANPPIVSMLVTGGTERRQDEPPRMEVDDSLLFNIVALDQETAITRVGVTVVVRNNKTTGTVIDTIFMDSVMNPAISGTVPVTFGMMPLDLPATVFTEADVPDTLFFELTGWAFDAAPTANCGATVDPEGSVASLACSGTGPVHASGIQGGFLERLIVAGRTVGIPQGALIADAVVDTLRELMLLSDFNFGIVRPFDLRNELFLDNVPVGSDPWGVGIDLTEDRLLVGNSGGTNISVVDLGPRSPGSPAVGNEVDRYQTQDLKVYQVDEAFDAIGRKIFPVTFFDYSDRPQFLAQAASGFILFSTVPAEANLPGTIREYDPVDREIRFFVGYAGRANPGNPQIQIINADSVFAINGARQFIVCDHTRGNFGNASCIIASDSLSDATIQVAAKIAGDGWDVEIFTDLDIGSIGLTDTTLVAASGDREFIAFGEGDTPGRAGRVMLYRSADGSISNGLQVTDLVGNAEEKVFGLAMNLDGSLGVVRGTMAYFFGPDPSGVNVLRMLGTNDRINPVGAGAALHPDNDITASPPAGDDPSRRLTFLGSGDARIEIVDAFHYEAPRGALIIRDPILGPLRISRSLPPDPPGVILKLYGITENGVVVIPVKDTDIIPF
jgi:hypothetical protein